MAQASRIQTLIIDGEPLACEKIRQMVRDNPQIAVLGEYANLREAASVIAARAPDLLFLDVQTPNGSDLAALIEFAPERLPLVVFTTAYDHYAVRAFETRALEYLLKPFDRERFNTVMGRALAHLSSSQRNRQQGRKLLAALEELRRRAVRPEAPESRPRASFFSLRPAQYRWA